MRDLLLAVPSRGRPGNIARLWEAMNRTCRGDTELVVGLDDDDPELPAYRRWRESCADPAIPDFEIRSGLRQVVGWVNELAVPRASQYRFTGHIGDDNVPVTPGWDVKIMEALGKTPFAFGNDLYPRAPGSLSCHVFMRSEVVQTLGYFAIPHVCHMYCDVAWMAWGVATGITYLDDVIIEHLHYTTGKSPHDASYAASTGLIPADLANWHAYCREDLNSDIRKLGGTEFTPQALAQFNADLNIPDRF